MILRRRRITLFIYFSVVLYLIARNISRWDTNSLKYGAVQSTIPTEEIYPEKDEAGRNFANGIFPLPKRISYGIQKPENSDIPDIFFEKRRNISKHDFHFTQNPYYACLNNDRRTVDKDIFLLVLIASALWEFQRRNIIRRTWASEVIIHGKRVKYLFFVANDQDEFNNEKLKEEFIASQDIVQDDFKETYRNLTLKTQGQLKWATYFCPFAQYYMHVDDDVVPDIQSIVREHMETAQDERVISCAKVFKPRVRRDGKWITSVEEYSREQYPLACVGWCFIIPRIIMSDLYYMSLDTPLLHLEDVAFTGILREKIGDIRVKKMKGGELMCQHKGWPKDRPTNDKLINTWNDLIKRRKSKS